MRWGDYPGLSKWAQCNHEDPFKRSRRVRVKGDARMGAEVTVMPSEDRERGSKPRNAVSRAEAGKGKETGSLLERDRAPPPTH